MRFHLDIMGMEEFLSDLADLPQRANAAAARTMNFVAQSTAQRAKQSIQTGRKSGRVYYLNGRSHQASAPGEAPANLTGKLISSIRWTRMTDKPGSFATAGSNLSYAATLEFGGFVQATGKFAGLGSVYVEPRPFLAPAFEAAIVQAEKVLKAEFERGR